MNDATIREGERKATVELTVKEAMALAAGVRFHEQPEIAAGARRKVRSTLENLLFPEAGKLHYQLIEA